jgi:hypothetical protein
MPALEVDGYRRRSVMSKVSKKAVRCQLLVFLTSKLERDVGRIVV